MNLQVHTNNILNQIEASLQKKNLHLLAPEDEKQKTSEIIRSAILELPKAAQKRIQAEFFGHGPLEELILDPSITEIMMNQDYVHFEKSGFIYQHNDHFQCAFTLDRFFNRIFDTIGRHPTLTMPFIDGSWNGFRVHLVRNPICNNSIQLTLRRHSERHWSLNDLINHKMMTPQLADKLLTSFQKKENLLIVGTTGSGKTTLINALIQKAHSMERLILIEDTDELIVPNSVSVKMLTRLASHNLPLVNQQSLLMQALRMRPDRILVGEVRGPEAKDLLLTLSTGHSGFLGSLHAKSAREALWRLEMLVQMGAPQWSLDTIRKLIQVSLDKIVVTERHHGTRRIREVMRLSGLEHHGFLLEPEYEINRSSCNIQIGPRRNIV